MRFLRQLAAVFRQLVLQQFVFGLGIFDIARDQVDEGARPLDVS
jgi:hypothetical protein